MLDSDQEPSYNFSKNLLLLPRILKLIKDMVDDSTPLIRINEFIVHCSLCVDKLIAQIFIVEKVNVHNIVYYLLLLLIAHCS